MLAPTGKPQIQPKMICGMKLSGMDNLELSGRRKMSIDDKSSLARQLETKIKGNSAGIKTLPQRDMESMTLA